MQPFVSICLFAYQQEYSVRFALDSLFKQTYRNYEIVINDDGSSDGTVDVIERRLESERAKHHKINFFKNKQNRGLASSINAAMNAANGDLIVVAAGDDISSSDRLSKIVQTWEFTNRRALLLHSDAFVIDSNNAKIGYIKSGCKLDKLERSFSPPYVQRPADEVEGHVVRKQAARGAKLLGATQAWSPKLFEMFGPLNEGLEIEDEVMALRASLLGNLVHINQPLVSYRVGGISDWGRRTKKNSEARSQEANKARMKAFMYKQKMTDLSEWDGEQQELCEIVACELNIWSFKEAVAKGEFRKAMDYTYKLLVLGVTFRQIFRELIKSYLPMLTQLKVQNALNKK